ncbi:MAG: hypothetical protein L0Y44_01200 [Phycisphaerales bacterium]|nr:hypothetical protein [Phycisphaerales bacterium]MCI0674449.1 hypothetical protein [Phycisphaerales bacterium]
MSDHQRKSHPANLPGTPGAALALLTVVAIMSSMHAASHARVGCVPTETRSTMSEAQTIRDVAQAVVAAARELVGADRILPNCSAFSEHLAISPPADHISLAHLFSESDQISLCPISDERLLDLPPPGC